MKERKYESTIEGALVKLEANVKKVEKGQMNIRGILGEKRGIWEGKMMLKKYRK